VYKDFKKGVIKMAKQDLLLIYSRTKRETEIAVAQVQRQFNLPAYLMIGILEGVLSKFKDEALMELSASSDRYAEALQQEAEKEKGENNATFTNESDS
jgi:hypothetical protein